LLYKIISDEFSKEADSNKIKDALLEVEQIVFNEHKKGLLSISFELSHIKLYLEILSCAVLHSEDKDGEEETKEKSFKYPYETGSKDENGKPIIEHIEFSIRERLAMLRLFTQCSFLERKSEWRKSEKKDKDGRSIKLTATEIEYNKRYEICLSIIMGINPISFKKNPNPFEENFWGKGTDSVRKAQVKTLGKFKKVTEKVRTQSSFKTIFDNLDLTFKQ
jgi:hypothetical protein